MLFINPEINWVLIDPLVWVAWLPTQVQISDHLYHQCIYINVIIIIRFTLVFCNYLGHTYYISIIFAICVHCLCKNNYRQKNQFGATAELRCEQVVHTLTLTKCTLPHNQKKIIVLAACY